MESPAEYAGYTGRNFECVAGGATRPDWRGNHAEFQATYSNHYSLGIEFFYRNPYCQSQRGIWRFILGILDAWGYVWRRDGFYIRAGEKRVGSTVPPGNH